MGEDGLVLMETTEKFFTYSEEDAEKKIEKYKEHPDASLIDYKLSVKETKAATYYIVTLKLRFASLNEAKELA